MSNTTFGNLKIGALRRVDHYNANDSDILQTAGGLINDIISEIQVATPTSMYWIDLDNTVSTVADQAYVDLTETNIIEVLEVYQRDTDTKLERMTRDEYIQAVPDSTVFTGTPELKYTEEQVLNASGENIFRLFLVPTPSSVMTLRYNFMKNARFSADGTSADAEFCPLPTMYDALIYAMFKPRFFSLIDPEAVSRIQKAEIRADNMFNQFIQRINSKKDTKRQMQSFRDRGPLIINRVKTTPAP